MSEIEEIQRRLAETEAQRDEARLENASIRLRACDAHEACWRAMRGTPEEALEAVQDDGYLHTAIHRVLDGPDGTAQARWDAAMQGHLDAIGKRVIRAELEALELRRQLNQRRASVRRLRTRHEQSGLTTKHVRRVHSYRLH